MTGQMASVKLSTYRNEARAVDQYRERAAAMFASEIEERRNLAGSAAEEVFVVEFEAAWKLAALAFADEVARHRKCIEAEIIKRGMAAILDRVMNELGDAVLEELRALGQDPNDIRERLTTWGSV